MACSWQDYYIYYGYNLFNGEPKPLFSNRKAYFILLVHEDDAPYSIFKISLQLMAFLVPLKLPK